MIYQELKEFIETLNETQLQQQVVVFDGDKETAIMIEHSDISEEDIYWEHHGDCLGPLKEAKEDFSDEEWEDEKEDLIIVPKGTVTLHSI